MLNLYYLVS